MSEREREREKERERERERDLPFGDTKTTRDFETDPSTPIQRYSPACTDSSKFVIFNSDILLPAETIRTFLGRMSEFLYCQVMVAGMLVVQVSTAFSPSPSSLLLGEIVGRRSGSVRKKGNDYKIMIIFTLLWLHVCANKQL